MKVIWLSMILLWAGVADAVEPAPLASSPAAQDQAQKFDPGDFEWLRGRYSDSPAERRQWEKMLEWARSVAAQRTDAVSEAVERHGVRLRPSDGDRCYGHDACQWVIRAERAAARIDTWDAFSAAWREAKPVVAAYLLATRRAEEWFRRISKPATPDVQLKARALGDQLLRGGWLDNTLPLSPNAQSLFNLALSIEISRVDGDNTAWLKEFLATSDWPLPPAVSREGEETAWLIVLHARHDPGFRLQVLDLMRKRVKAGLLPEAYYATKLDHVLFETTGVQRYGTKGECVSGRFVPVPSEDDTKLVELRRVARLPTLEEQAAMMAKAC